MEILLIHFSMCRLSLGISCLKWDIFVFSRLYLMSDNPVHVSGCTVLRWQKTLQLHNIGCWKCMYTWSSLTCAWSKWSNSSWGIGLAYWTNETVERLLPASVDHLVLIRNFLWGGAPNLLLSCQSTVFHSVDPPWLVWYMDRTGWGPLLQCVYIVHIWMSQ